MAPCGRCDSPDDLIREALLLALPALLPRTTRYGNPSLWPLESVLAKELVNGITQLGVDSSRVDTTKRYIEHDWHPTPEGIDLYVTSEAGSDLLLVAELKLEEVPQTMWDLYKMIAARKLAGSPSAYLVIGTHDSCWTNRPCAELFSPRVGASEVVDTVTLFKRNRPQYKKDLMYPARMLSVPTTIRTTSVLSGARAKHYPHLEFRVASVAVEDSSPITCTDGWPAGVEPLE